MRCPDPDRRSSRRAPQQQTRPRHAAPKEPVNRTVLLPAVLLAAAGTAFAGLAVVPAAADQGSVERVVAASAFSPVDVPAPGAVLAERPPTC